jgi:hypothetical protein
MELPGKRAKHGVNVIITGLRYNVELQVMECQIVQKFLKMCRPFCPHFDSHPQGLGAHRKC